MRYHIQLKRDYFQYFNSILMGGEGHIADMITRMKNNLSGKKARKEQHQKLNEAYRKSRQKTDTHPIRELQISMEKLEGIKDKIKRASTKERKFRILISSIITLIITFSIFYFVWLSFFK